MIRLTSFLCVYVALVAVTVHVNAQGAIPTDQGASPTDKGAIPTEIVSTTNGRVQGALDNGVSAFKGIRYGAPPVGDLRFMPPQAPVPWDHVEDAQGYGAPAIQLYNRFGDTELTRQIASIFTTQSEMKIDNEDCLFLNVWTPATDSKKRPVMVWFHGGGFAYGSGSWPVYDGANLARNGDVVVVTVNHRLNVFGYLHLADIGGEKYRDSGNVGMLDLVQSLEWVRDNISAFGGDPENVTIMGESGGGAKVSTLLAMPRATGLFHKAIIQSGPGLTAMSAQRATANAREILKELRVSEDNLEVLTSLPTEAIEAAVHKVQAKMGGGFARGLRLAPVVDGGVLPRDPFTPDAPASAKDVPILIGWNKDEMTIFNASAPWFGRMTDAAMTEQLQQLYGEKAEELLDTYRKAHPDYSPTYLFNIITGDSRMFAGSVRLAERKAAQADGAPVYMYYLVWDTPVAGGVLKSPHTLDIPFMFNNVDKSVVLTGNSEAARKLEAQMAGAWLAFARNGNPKHELLPEWPAYTETHRATLVFDETPRVEMDVKSAARKLFNSGG